MAQTHNPAQQSHQKKILVPVIIFAIVAIAGLAYVKWIPYYGKSMLAANTHSIGDSILGDPANQAASWAGAWSYAVTYFQSVWKAAVLGIILGSLIQVLLPANWLMKVLGKTNFGSTAVAGLASLPGMMCTCCAAPVAAGLRKKQASVGASLAFWLGNPTLNPAALIFMTFVLSWKFTLLRLVFGIALTFGVSYLANRLVFGIALTFGVSYLANRLVPATEKVDMDQVLKDAEEEEKGPLFTRWLKSLGSMTLYIVPAYFLSVLLMGAVRVWLFPHVSEAASNSLLTIILFSLAGMLFVIPTAAEIPIIQTFMSFGLGGGPAAALLITLPAISLPSLLLVARSFPRKVLWFTAASVVVLGIVSGMIGKFLL